MTTYVVSVLDSECHNIDTTTVNDKTTMIDIVVGMRELGYVIKSITFEFNWLAIIIMIDGSVEHYPTQKSEDHIGKLWVFENRRDIVVIEDSELRR